MRRFFLIVFLLASGWSQQFYWPEYLAVPTPVTPDADSLQAPSNLAADQLVGQDYYRVRVNTTTFARTSLLQRQQFLRYELSQYHSLAIQNHSVDCSGFFLKQRYPFESSSLGIEWIPVVTVNRDYGQKSGNAVTYLRVGPLMDFSYLELPVRFSTGSSIDAWQNLPLRLSKLSTIKSDAGVYAKLKVGDNTRPLREGIPIVAAGQVTASFMNQSKITQGDVNSLYYADVPFADTLFVYCADTLSKGRTAFFKKINKQEYAYLTTSNRSINSLGAMVGMRNIGSYLLRPSLLYSFARRSTDYLKNANTLGDFLNTDHTIGVAVFSVAGTKLDYGASVVYKHAVEDRLYNSKISSFIVTKDSLSNRDTLYENSKDFIERSIATAQSLSKTFSNGMKVRYTLDVSIDKKRYPHFFVTLTNGLRDTSSRNDRDKAMYHNLAELTLWSSPRLLCMVSGEYIENVSAFLRKECSMNNQTGTTYAIDLSIVYNAVRPLTLSQNFDALSEIKQYHFPQFQKNPPPMNRRFGSKTAVNYLCRHSTAIDGYWNEIYIDNGYLKSSAATRAQPPASLQNSDTYAILNKSLETALEVGVKHFLDTNFSVRCAGYLQNIYEWQWPMEDEVRSRDYIQPQWYQFAFVAKPSIEIKSSLRNQCLLQSFIRCVLDITLKRRSGGVNSMRINHWEAGSSLLVEF
ncbi:MAG: hypothetical protein JW795_14795 [Chitinivibrionales bacterium]|nr:hypothetical protein [Chitinivibrionales bacterium]